MKLSAIISLLADHDAGIELFTGTLGFTFVEDTKRWVGE